MEPIQPSESTKAPEKQEASQASQPSAAFATPPQVALPGGGNAASGADPNAMNAFMSAFTSQMAQNPLLSATNPLMSSMMANPMMAMMMMAAFSQNAAVKTASASADPSGSAPDPQSHGTHDATAHLQQQAPMMPQMMGMGMPQMQWPMPGMWGMGNMGGMGAAPFFSSFNPYAPAAMSAAMGGYPPMPMADMMDMGGVAGNPAAMAAAAASAAASAADGLTSVENNSALAENANTDDEMNSHHRQPHTMQQLQHRTSTSPTDHSAHHVTVAKRSGGRGRPMGRKNGASPALSSSHSRLPASDDNDHHHPMSLDDEATTPVSQAGHESSPSRFSVSGREIKRPASAGDYLDSERAVSLLPESSARATPYTRKVPAAARRKSTDNDPEIRNLAGAAAIGGHHFVSARKTQERRRPRMRVSVSCLPCRSSHRACNGSRPCNRCTRLEIADMCVNAIQRRRGPAPKKPEDQAAAAELFEKQQRQLNSFSMTVRPYALHAGTQLDANGQAISGSGGPIRHRHVHRQRASASTVAAAGSSVVSRKGHTRAAALANPFINKGADDTDSDLDEEEMRQRIDEMGSMDGLEELDDEEDEDEEEEEDEEEKGKVMEEFARASATEAQSEDNGEVEETRTESFRHGDDADVDEDDEGKQLDMTAPHTTTATTTMLAAKASDGDDESNDIVVDSGSDESTTHNNNNNAQPTDKHPPRLSRQQQQHAVSPTLPKAHSPPPAPKNRRGRPPNRPRANV